MKAHRIMKKFYLVRTIILAGSLLLQLSTLCFHARSAAGDVDLSFDPGSGVTSPVSIVVVQPDGKVLIGGPFTFINGTNHYGSARLNADGSWDSTFISDSFNPDLAFVIQNDDCPGGNDYQCIQSYAASTLLVQYDGKVLIGGYSSTYVRDLLSGEEVFTKYRSFVARVHADGSRDINFAPVIGSIADVPEQIVLAVQSDGKVVVGSTYSGIARLNADGSPDNSFSPGISSWVASIALQADGKMLIGGNFSTMHGTNVSYGVARLNANGSLDSSFNPGTGTFGVLSVTLQPDGKVLIGGSFTSFSGTPRNRIARLNANGSLDFSFNPGTGANGNVSSIALQPDGNILIGGDFTIVNGVLRPHVARLYGAAPFFLSNLGIVSNQFGFDVTGGSNSVIIVEASTNLVNWTALATNTLGAAPLHFNDPGWTNFPKRFYRAKLVP
jgi:uncharacterized delta-60 repeat protein